MRFLLDVNISPRLSALLEPFGHECRSVVLMNLHRHADFQILETALEAGETLITHDLDFGHLLAFSGDARPSVVIFRIHQLTAEVIAEKITAFWDQIEQPLKNGAIVIFEESNLRIRHLPIKKRG